MPVNLFTFLHTIIIWITAITTCNVNCNLVDLASGFVNHSDLHFISEKILEENFLEISPLYISSISNTMMPTTLSSINTSFIFPSRDASVKLLIRFNNTQSTLDGLLQLGSSPEIIEHKIKPWILILWPDSVQNEESAGKILDAEIFKQSVQGYSIASQLVIVFMKTKNISLTSSTTSSETVNESFCYEVYNINGYHIVKYLDLGLIHFRCNYCRGPAIRRSDFYGLTLNVTGTEDKEYNDDLHYEENIAGELMISSEGFSAKILQILKKSLNFSVKAHRSGDWGRFFPQNNSWYGAVKDVADGIADLGIAITIMRPNRAGQVSFLPAADEHIISAFFKPPESSDIRDIFARPFKPDLWAAVFSTWIVLAFFMIFFSLIRKRYDIQDQDGAVEPDFTQDSFIWALATACQQGWDEHPVAGSLRTIFISGSFTGVVAYAGYSAAIVSTLSLRIDPIQTPEQLLKSSLHLGIRGGFISELLEQNNTNDLMTEYYHRLYNSREDERYFNVAAGYEHMLKHPYAFISTRDTLYDHLKMTYNNTEICNMKELQILKHGFPTGHFVSKNSPYKEFLRYIYVTIREPGISWKLRTNYTYKRRCLEASDNAGQALGAHDVFTAFMILSAGYILSLIFITIERLFRVGSTLTYIR